MGAPLKEHVADGFRALAERIDGGRAVRRRHLERMKRLAAENTVAGIRQRLFDAAVRIAEREL